jgi:RNA polymerase sigma-B factor
MNGIAPQHSQATSAAAHRRRDDQRLIRRHRGGDLHAREEFVMRYFPLARRLALRYRREPEPAEDLIQVAAVGLVKAVDRWDPDRGLAFSTYAVPTILGELRRHLRDTGWGVRPPRVLQELCLVLEAARADMRGSLGREPTVSELSTRLDRPAEEVVEALGAAEGRRLASLDAPVGDEELEAATVGDLVGGLDPEYERAETRATIERLTRRLDRRSREVLRLRFEDDLIQSEIAARVGCSQMQVSRILRASLDALGRAGAPA